MGETSFVECQWCHEVVSLAAHRAHHGEWGPRCRQIRSNALLRELDWRWAGSFWALLEAAGVARQLPCEAWYYEPVERVDPETGEITVTGHTQHRVVSFDPAVPTWAYDLAKRLTQDEGLAARLGYLQMRQLITVRTKAKYNGPDVEVTRVWRDVALPKTMPFEVRVKIIRVAASNTLARELVYDDPESAAVIIRDSV